MVVICGGTTGYIASLDLRYHWMQQKRFQGSHFANDEQCVAVNGLVVAGKIDPCLARVFPFDQMGECHQMLYENRHPPGKLAVLVNAAREGMTTLE
jgi:crotonyl-CoA carboxylase/reductase